MTLRALIRPLVRDPLRLPLERRGGWTPRVLFAAGEQGGWWDPSDFSTLFQDSAGTTRVTAVGQPVGKILDKSGQGNHRTQATAASRPTLQQDGGGFYHLLYDGVDDFMQTASVDFSATSKAGIFLAVNKTTNALASLVEVGINPTASAGFGLVHTTAPAIENNLFATSRALFTASVSAAPVSVVLASSFDTTAGTLATQVSCRVNGVAGGGTGGALASGALPNAQIFIGRRGGTTLPFSGREYQTIIRGAASTASQIAQAERFVGSRMGIAL